jgi:hypothetical protein
MNQLPGIAMAGSGKQSGLLYSHLTRGSVGTDGAAKLDTKGALETWEWTSRSRSVGAPWVSTTEYSS